MENFDQPIDLIERYFEGSLSDLELQTFQEKLAADPDFAEAFQIEKDIVEGIQASGNQTLKKRLNHIHEKKINLSNTTTTKTPPAKTVSLFQRYRTIAAVIALAIISGIVFWQLNESSSYDRTFASYYQTPSFDDLTRGESSTTAPLLDAAKNKFSTKDFKNTLTDLQSFLAQNPTNESALLMQGISQLETQQYEKAIISFSKIPNSSDRYDTAVWYTGLSYLKQNQPANAKIQFENLANGSIPTGPKRVANAKKILKSL